MEVETLALSEHRSAQGAEQCAESLGPAARCPFYSMSGSERACQESEYPRCPESFGTARSHDCRADPHSQSSGRLLNSFPNRRDWSPLLEARIPEASRHLCSRES